MIEAIDLCKKFERSVRQGRRTKKEEFLAVDHVSLQAKEGEIIGILGPNGAGKTTLLRMLGMLMTPTKGSVRLTDENGNEITDTTKRKEAIGYLSGNTKLYPRFSIREYLEFLGELYGYDKKKIRERTEEIFELLNMKKHNFRLRHLDEHYFLYLVLHNSSSYLGLRFLGFLCTS